MLHKPIREKKSTLPSYQSMKNGFLPVVRMNQQPQIENILNLNLMWKFSKNGFTICSKMKSFLCVPLYSDTAATFNENLYKPSSWRKTGLHTKRARLTQVVHTAPAAALTSKNFFPQKQPKTSKKTPWSDFCVCLLLDLIINKKHQYVAFKGNRQVPGNYN